jgi:mRNA interferase MazF
VGAFTVGQVVILPFPFSDLSQQKNRPALLLADAGRGDWVLCQITSNAFSDSRAIELAIADFSSGSLQRVSYARPAKLFTAHQSLFSGIAGSLNPDALDRVRNAVVALLRGIAI